MSNEILDQNFTNPANVTMRDFSYPLTFEFKISTIANDFIAKDAQGNVLGYVRQKMFKFKEAISVYSDESRQEMLFKIDADRVIDFNANYAFTNATSEKVGSVGRRGAKSILKAHYEVMDASNNQEFLIQEENPWAKFFDALMGEVPIVGMFTGYMFNPRYTVKRHDGTLVARLSKEKSFFGRRFKLEQVGEINAQDGENERMLLALMMMSLLERRRG